MMAASKKMLDQEPSEIELLLPFHAAGTLNARDARRVDEALASDEALARQYAVIREEYAETIHLNESLGAPSARAMAEAVRCDRRRARAQAIGVGQSVGAGFRILCKPVAADAGLVGHARRGGAAAAGRPDRRGAGEEPERHVPDRFAQPERASSGPITRDLGGSVAQPPRALVRFAPEARVADITALLNTYQASIVDGVKDGMFRLQFGNKAMSKDEAASLVSKLASEKIVSLAVATP